MSNYILQLASQAAPVAVYTKKGDRNYAIGFEIYDGKDPYDLTGCTVLINLDKPDGHAYIGVAVVVEETAGRVDVRLDNERQMTAAEGEGTLELVIINDGLRRGTANVRWIVQESPGSELVSGTVIDGIAVLADEVAANVNRTTQAAEGAARALSAAEESARAAARSAAEARGIALGDVLDIIYPVGSIVQYADASIDPNVLLGGTWQRIQGKFLFGADSSHAIGSEGGSETQTLTIANLPRHMHYTIRMGMQGETSPDYLHTVARSDLEHSPWENARYQLYGVDAEANAGKSSYVGNGTAHNNMPPYLTVYIWKRTA